MDAQKLADHMNARLDMEETLTNDDKLQISLGIAVICEIFLRHGVPTNDPLFPTMLRVLADTFDILRKEK